MIDIGLKFKDRDEMLEVLSELLKDKHNVFIDEIGILFKEIKPEEPEDGKPKRGRKKSKKTDVQDIQIEEIPGYHVNVRSTNELNIDKKYIVTPKTKMRDIL